MLEWILHRYLLCLDTQLIHQAQCCLYWLAMAKRNYRPGSFPSVEPGALCMQTKVLYICDGSSNTNDPSDTQDSAPTTCYFFCPARKIVYEAKLSYVAVMSTIVVCFDWIKFPWQTRAYAITNRFPTVVLMITVQSFDQCRILLAVFFCNSHFSPISSFHPHYVFLALLYPFQILHCLYAQGCKMKGISSHNTGF